MGPPHSAKRGSKSSASNNSAGIFMILADSGHQCGSVYICSYTRVHRLSERSQIRLDRPSRAPGRALLIGLNRNVAPIDVEDHWRYDHITVLPAEIVGGGSKQSAIN